MNLSSIGATIEAKKPDNVSFEDAACLGTPGLTAWNGLFDKAELKPGAHVFVNGCTGAVGESAVQLALMTGAKVSGSCSAEAIPRAHALGVGNDYNYRTADLENISQRFDVVYDTAAAMTTAVGLAMLRDGGVFLDINPTLGKFMRSMFDKRLKPIICKARADILDGLARAAAEGKLRLPVAAPVPLSDAMRLLHELEQGRKLAGKGLVVMD